MREDHGQARQHAGAILEALETKDREAIAEHLDAYAELLTEHIRKEDEVLYRWMDKNLSPTQVGELVSRFNDAEREMGFSSEKYEAFIRQLEEEFHHS